MEIKAEILADSVNFHNGRRVTTFLLTYPRYILPQILTHRVFERNTASSRAIPIKKMMGSVWREPYVPIHWGRVGKGMSDAGPLSNSMASLCRWLWLLARYPALLIVFILSKVGLSKEISNRLLEPWAWTHQVLTGTEWKNFYRLRNHEGAQPEIQLLAKLMLEAHAKSHPKILKVGEWHLPFWRHKDREFFRMSGEDEINYSLKICTARCARTSYINYYGKDSPDSDFKLHDRLRKEGHFSTFGHCCRAERSDKFYANLRGFKPYRKVLGGDTFDDDSLFNPAELLRT